MTTVPEPSDATRFATRPKQRKTELVNATDNEMGKDRKKTVERTLGLLAEGHRWPAQLEMVAGMWRQYSIDDDRTLDPETVAEQFARAEQELTNAITIRALIAQAGLTHG
jgi:hypothetical protein